MQVFREIPRCEYCFKILRSSERYAVRHINIEQEPKEHKFCGKECKTKFIELVQKNNGVVKGWDKKLKRETR